MRYLSRLMCVLVLGLLPLAACSDADETGGDGGTAGHGGSAGQGGEGGSAGAIEWIAGIDFRVGVSGSANSDILYLTESKLDEYKPAYSPDGSKVVFFRALEYGDVRVDRRCSRPRSRQAPPAVGLFR